MGRKRNIVIEHEEQVLSVTQLTWEKFLLARKEGKDVTILDFPTRNLGKIDYHIADLTGDQIDYYLEDLLDLEKSVV